MKQIYLLFIFLMVSMTFNAQVNYTANGNSGFGGAVGGSNMTISDNGTDVTITFNRGAGTFDNEMVIYIDSQTGGFSSTVDFADPDDGDKLRRAINGAGTFGGATRSVVNFPAGMEPDFAIAVNTSFGGLWELINNASFPFITGVGNPTSNTDASFTMSFSKADIGIGVGDAIEFTFVVTYLDGFGGGGVFRSDEGYGTGLAAGNPGTNDVTFTSSELYRESTTYTYNGSWSPSNPNGTSTLNDVFTIASGDAVITTNTDSRIVTINPGASLTINSGVNLNVADALTLESISTSYSSLIPEGTITGTVNYERHVNGNSTLGDTNAIGDNDLISAPVSGQTFGDFATANPNLLENSGDATEKAFAIFDKTSGTYENYFTTTNAGTTLDAGVGYRAATNNTSTLTFTGTVNTGTVSYNIVNSGPIQADWNLIGNPYPSYVLARNFLEHEVDTGVRNVDLFQPDTAAIYGYDGDVNNNTNSYTVYNLATTLPTTVIAPGQGFLVSADPADVAAYDVEFTPAIRTTGTDDDFIIGRGGSLINLELQLTTATDGAVTDFYFNANASLGLDPGYDAAIFGGTAPPFSIYSLLVEDNDGTPFVIQALGDMDFGDTTVALGVNANQGEQLTFSVSTNTLPGTVEVYLDDTVASTSTLLSSGDYVLTPATELIGTGRFYLRFSDSSLSTVENSFDDLTIYTNQAQRSIVISGQLVEHTIANIYDIQGRLVRSQQLDTTTTLQTITASELGTGVYIVELSNDRTSKTEKIILN